MSIDKLIQLTEKKAELLRELKEAQIYEACKYHLIKDSSRTPREPAYYLLYEIATGKLVKDGSAAMVKAYINRHQAEQLTYNYSFTQNNQNN